MGERFVAVAFCCLAWANIAIAAPSQRVLLVMGDSLSAAYGLAASEGWVSLLGERLATTHPQWTVVNASISGETTAGGVARIDTALAEHQPSLLLIELGANDALRGLPMDLSQANLERMIVAAKAADAEVMLVGMEIPPNYGPEYTAQFRTMYRALAQRHELPLLPFLLEPIARDRDAFQPDNLHPVAAVQSRILDHVWSVLEPLL
jgi:acyl-CoA thioesterase-1